MPNKKFITLDDPQKSFELVSNSIIKDKSILMWENFLNHRKKVQCELVKFDENYFLFKLKEKTEFDSLNFNNNIFYFHSQTHQLIFKAPIEKIGAMIRITWPFYYKFQEGRTAPRFDVFEENKLLKFQLGNNPLQIERRLIDVSENGLSFMEMPKFIERYRQGVTIKGYDQDGYEINGIITHLTPRKTIPNHPELKEAFYKVGVKFN